MGVEFSKYHGLGNDFLIVFDQPMDADTARAILDRNTGVGADGLIKLDRSDVADFSFVLFQPDGSVAEVSGNGLRCVGRFLYEKGIMSDTTIKIEAAGDIKVLELIVKDGSVGSIRADMGVPVEEGEVVLHGLTFKKISTGNPHAVTFVENIDAAPVTEIGPLVENDSSFPNRTNVEFVKVEGDIVHARFWERGVGVTQASGTGSCASLVASGLRKATVRTLGGDLHIERDEMGRLFMTGPAVHVFDGRTP
ncbi:MAG: diaminopimelate epimerase [Actinomycetota bacterium]|nr:diaminopimelate epimerase [Actinomycetota bacterium]